MNAWSGHFAHVKCATIFVFCCQNVPKPGTNSMSTIDSNSLYFSINVYLNWNASIHCLPDQYFCFFSSKSCICHGKIAALLWCRPYACCVPLSSPLHVFVCAFVCVWTACEWVDIRKQQRRIHGTFGLVLFFYVCACCMYVHAWNV